LLYFFCIWYKQQLLKRWSWCFVLKVCTNACRKVITVYQKLAVHRLTLSSLIQAEMRVLPILKRENIFNFKWHNFHSLTLRDALIICQEVFQYLTHKNYAYQWSELFTWHSGSQNRTQLLMLMLFEVSWWGNTISDFFFTSTRCGVHCPAWLCSKEKLYQPWQGSSLMTFGRTAPSCDGPVIPRLMFNAVSSRSADASLCISYHNTIMTS
jgi:hypothetical protein